ncbi:MAG: MBL fold metallo-hydrolase [Oscillospiraceae bacterium]
MKLYHTVLGPIETNCYLAADDAGVTAVIDPGANGERIAELLEHNQLTPGMILLTHGHFDHIGGINELQKRYPGLRVAIGKNDEPMLAAAAYNQMALSFSKKEDYEGLGADLLVAEGDVVSVGTLRFAVLDTPGHTLGGVCYRCGELLFTGDTLFAGEVGRTDLAGGNYETLMRSLKKLAQLNENLTVLPGHDHSSTLDNERICGKR